MCIAIYNVNAFGATLIASVSGDKWQVFNAGNGTWIGMTGGQYFLNESYSYRSYSVYDTPAAALAAYNQGDDLFWRATTGIYGFNKPILLVDGTFNFGYDVSMDGIYNIQDYLPPEEPPTWYEILWDTFIDYFTDPVPFEWFKNLIDSIYGDDNEGGTISDNVTIGNPTLAPTPTPIPYSTVVIPKTDIITGETVYETNYYYVNPSGTPVVTSSPPTNSPTSGGGGGGSTEYVPINGDPYSLPYLDWLSNVDIGENDYNGIDSIGDGLCAVDDIGSEYSDGMSAVQDSTGTLPTIWILLIGIAAAIPLLAGIISRFLGG